MLLTKHLLHRLHEAVGIKLHLIVSSSEHHKRITLTAQHCHSLIHSLQVIADAAQFPLQRVLPAGHNSYHVDLLKLVHYFISYRATKSRTSDIKREKWTTQKQDKGTKVWFTQLYYRPW